MSCTLQRSCPLCGCVLAAPSPSFVGQCKMQRDTCLPTCFGGGGGEGSETRTDEGPPLPPCFNVPSPPLPNERPTRPQPHASSSQQPALISHQLKVSDAVSRRAPAGSSASGSGCKPGRGQERLTVLWLIRGASGTLGAGSSGPSGPPSTRSSLVYSVPGRQTDGWVWC